MKAIIILKLSRNCYYVFKQKIIIQFYEPPLEKDVTTVLQFVFRKWWQKWDHMEQVAHCVIIG